VGPAGLDRNGHAALLRRSAIDTVASVHSVAGLLVKELRAGFTRPSIRQRAAVVSRLASRVRRARAERRRRR